MPTTARNILITLTLLFGFWALSTPAEATSEPNVLIISVDAVHAEYLSLYGGKAEVPALERFADRPSVTVFERAYVTAPWSMPSLASMYTGKFPPKHGAKTLTDDVSPFETTLAEHMSEAGYRTFAISDNPFLNRHHGLAQGFDTVEEISDGKDVTNMIGQLVDEQPFFGHAHYMDPHQPYDGRDRLCPEPDGKLTDYSNMGLDGRVAVDDDTLNGFRCRYRAEVEYWDVQFDRLLKKLQAKDLLDNTLLIITADHGEAFMQHGRLGHNNSLHEEEIHVPLLVHHPGWPSKDNAYTVKKPVTLASLDSTVKSVLNDQDKGLFKATLPSGNYERPVFASIFDIEGERDRYALIGSDGRYKIIMKDANHDGGRHYTLYNLKNDKKVFKFAHLKRYNTLKERLSALLDKFDITQQQNDRQSEQERPDHEDSDNKDDETAPPSSPGSNAEGQEEKLPKKQRRELKGLGYL